MFTPVLTAKAKDCTHCQTKRNSTLLSKSTTGLLGTDSDEEDHCNFPLPPLNDLLSHTVINDFYTEASPAALQEAGCVVCGCLTPSKNCQA